MTPALLRFRDARREATFRLLSAAGAGFPAPPHIIRDRRREYWQACGRELRAAYALVRRRARFAGMSSHREFQFREARRYYAELVGDEPYALRPGVERHRSVDGERGRMTLAVPPGETVRIDGGISDHDTVWANRGGILYRIGKIIPSVGFLPHKGRLPGCPSFPGDRDDVFRQIVLWIQEHGISDILPETPERRRRR